MIPHRKHWSNLPSSDAGFVLPVSFGYDQGCFTSCGTDGDHAFHVRDLLKSGLGLPGMEKCSLWDPQE